MTNNNNWQQEFIKKFMQKVYNNNLFVSDYASKENINFDFFKEFIQKLLEKERKLAKIEALLKVSKPATDKNEPLGVGLKILTNINEELNQLQK